MTRKTTNTKVKLLLLLLKFRLGAYTPPPPLPQEGLFIIIIIIIIISILYLPAFEALAVSYSLAVQLVYGQVKLLMSLRMLSSHFET